VVPDITTKATKKHIEKGEFIILDYFVSSVVPDITTKNTKKHIEKEKLYS
jgi:hypothetical protein